MSAVANLPNFAISQVEVIDLTDDPDVVPLDRRQSEDPTKLSVADLQCKAMSATIHELRRTVRFWRSLAIGVSAAVVVGLSACGVVAAVR